LIADPVLDFLITVLGGAVATLLGIIVTMFWQRQRDSAQRKADAFRVLSQLDDDVTMNLIALKRNRELLETTSIFANQSKVVAISTMEPFATFETSSLSSLMHNLDLLRIVASQVRESVLVRKELSDLWRNLNQLNYLINWREEFRANSIGDQSFLAAIQVRDARIRNLLDLVDAPLRQLGGTVTRTASVSLFGPSKNDAN
jgi:hypothetical protein